MLVVGFNIHFYKVNMLEYFMLPLGGWYDKDQSFTDSVIVTYAIKFNLST